MQGGMFYKEAKDWRPFPAPYATLPGLDQELCVRQARSRVGRGPHITENQYPYRYGDWLINILPACEIHPYLPRCLLISTSALQMPHRNHTRDR